MIHETAIVDPGASLAGNVTIGPWTIIGAGVEIAAGTKIGPHVVIRGPTKIGEGNTFYQFSSIGEDPQDKKYSGEETFLEIGDGNVIREYCTVNRGTRQGGGVTRIGDDNWIMAYVHVAHDCTVGDGTILANGATLAGHVALGDFVTLGAFTIIHQFCTLGSYAFSAMGTVILKDVPPFVTVSGNTASAHGLNVEGLRRHGFSATAAQELKRAYKTVYRQGLTVEQALAELDDSAAEWDEIAQFVDFIRTSQRGIVR